VEIFKNALIKILSSVKWGIYVKQIVFWICL
jgi:hypothetical protein